MCGTPELQLVPPRRLFFPTSVDRAMPPPAHPPQHAAGQSRSDAKAPGLVLGGSSTGLSVHSPGHEPVVFAQSTPAPFAQRVASSIACCCPPCLLL